MDKTNETDYVYKGLDSEDLAEWNIEWWKDHKKHAECSPFPKKTIEICDHQIEKWKKILEDLKNRK